VPQTQWRKPVTDKRHTYSIRVNWTGNQGTGTSAYRAYSRAHEISAQGKTAIAGSSDPVFRGDAARWNPACSSLRFPLVIGFGTCTFAPTSVS
jgi:hypothetical protein